MALIFRPTSRSAVKMAPWARRLANAHAGQQGVWHAVQNGFILRAVGVGGNVIVYVIDVGAVVLFSARGAPYRFTAWPAGFPSMLGAYLPSQDLVVPSGVNADGELQETPQGAVGEFTPDDRVDFSTIHARFTSRAVPFDKFHAYSDPSSSGFWVAVGALESDKSATSNNGAFNVTVRLVSGANKHGLAGTDATYTPRIATQQCYIWDDAYIATLAGEPNLHLGMRRFLASMSRTDAGPWDTFGPWMGSAPYNWICTALRPALFSPDAVPGTPPLLCVAQTAFIHPPWTADYATNGERLTIAGVFAAGVQPVSEVAPASEDGSIASYPVAFAYTRLVRLDTLGVPSLVPQISTYMSHAEAVDPMNRLPNVVTCVGTVVGATNPQIIMFACTVMQDDTAATGVHPTLGHTLYTTWNRYAHYVVRMVVPTGAMTVVHASDFALDLASAEHFDVDLYDAYTSVFQIPTIRVYPQCSVEVVIDDAPVVYSYMPFYRMYLTERTGVYTIVGGDKRLSESMVDYSTAEFMLLRDDGVEITTGLRTAGYVACVPEYSGPYSIIGDTVTYGTGAGVGFNEYLYHTLDDARDNVTCDIGDNKLAVIAVPVADADQGNEVLHFTLIVLDAITGGFIEARGVLATAFKGNAPVWGISCVSREKTITSPDGDRTIPAVFLATLAQLPGIFETYQYVSTDGGRTWAKYLTGYPFEGTPYYLGSKMRPVQIGHAE